VNSTTQKINATTITMVGLTAAALYFCYLLFRPFAEPVVFAGVVAIVFYPLHRYVGRFVRNTSAAGLTSTLLALLLTVVPLGLVAAMASSELSGLYQSVSAWTAGQGGIPAYLINGLDRAAAWMSHQFGLPTPDIHAIAVRHIDEASSSLVRQGASLVTNLFSWLVSAAIAFVVLFFLFRDGEKGLAQVSAALPMSDARAAELRSRISSTVVANFYGIFAVGGTQGALTALGFWALGLESPILWGLVTAVFSLVPIIGAAGVWAPAGIILLLTGHMWKGLALLAWGAGVVSLSDNIVRPLIISERVKLHPLGVFFSLLGGIQVFGVIGLFIGPVILSVASALLGMWRQDLAARSAASDSHEKQVEAPDERRVA
jgi:predicted PurR-regulated permease PerM